MIVIEKASPASPEYVKQRARFDWVIGMKWGNVFSYTNDFWLCAMRQALIQEDALLDVAETDIIVRINFRLHD